MLKPYTDPRIGNAPRHYLAREPERLMLVPEPVRKCVLFVLYNDKDGKKQVAGTAFMVGIKDKEFGLAFGYCVTALHVLAKIYRDSADKNIILRVNLKDGGFEERVIPYDEWQKHPKDVSVDVAVLDWFPSPVKYDIALIVIESAVDQTVIEGEKIGAGDEVFITGLFVNHTGKNRNLPIVRTGNIAMMPEEKIHVGGFGDIDAYLIEARSIGGLSGSPVFVQKAPVKVVDKELYVSQVDHIYFWLGLIHGHFQVEPKKEVVNDLAAEEAQINMGIAIVVPAIKVIETINQPLFKERRDERIQQERDRYAPTPDTGDMSI